MVGKLNLGMGGGGCGGVRLQAQALAYSPLSCVKLVIVASSVDVIIIIVIVIMFVLSKAKSYAPAYLFNFVGFVKLVTFVVCRHHHQFVLEQDYDYNNTIIHDNDNDKKQFTGGSAIERKESLEIEED